MKEQDMPLGQSKDLSSEPYPYADKKTYEFLRGVVNDGTQHTLSGNANQETWVRNKNITGIYFSCNITKDELADMYGVSRQRVDQIISKTLRRFWDNSIGYDQMKFPIDSLSTENPKHRVRAMSRADQIRLESLISSGADDKEVEKRFGVGLDLVRQTMRKMEKREQITSRIEANKRIVKQLETLPVENYEERQRVMDQMTLAGYKSNRESFASISDVAAVFGRQLSKGGVMSSDRFIDELREMKVPVGVCVAPCSLKKGSGVGKRNIFVHKKDYERLQEMRENSTNPS